jgi:hypothetical protein
MDAQTVAEVFRVFTDCRLKHIEVQPLQCLPGSAELRLSSFRWRKAPGNGRQ